MYNADFHDKQLFDAQHVNKLMSMCKFTNPNTIFSDVVKHGVVTAEKSCKKTALTNIGAKIPSSRNSHVSTLHTNVKTSW